jgi:hypothetical protein
MLERQAEDLSACKIRKCVGCRFDNGDPPQRAAARFTRQKAPSFARNISMEEMHWLQVWQSSATDAAYRAAS